MVLNTPLSQKVSTYYYHADVCKDPNDYRSSRPEVFCKKGALKNLAKFTGKHLCRVSFLIKLQACARVSCLRGACRPAPLFKKITLVQVFSCECCEISKTPFFLEQLLWLLLELVLNGQHKE